MRKYRDADYIVFTQGVLREQKAQDIHRCSYWLGDYAFQVTKQKFYRYDPVGNRWFFAEPAAVPAAFKALLLIEGVLNA